MYVGHLQLLHVAACPLRQVLPRIGNGLQHLPCPDQLHKLLQQVAGCSLQLQQIPEGGTAGLAGTSVACLQSTPACDQRPAESLGLQVCRWCITPGAVPLQLHAL